MEALRHYEHTSLPQLVDVSNIWEMILLFRYQCYRHTSLQQQQPLQPPPVKAQVLCLKDVPLRVVPLRAVPFPCQDKQPVKISMIMVYKSCFKVLTLMIFLMTNLNWLVLNFLT